MRWTPGEGWYLLDRHLARLERFRAPLSASRIPQRDDSRRARCARVRSAAGRCACVCCSPRTAPFASSTRRSIIVERQCARAPRRASDRSGRRLSLSQDDQPRGLRTRAPSGLRRRDSVESGRRSRPRPRSRISSSRTCDGEPAGDAPGRLRTAARHDARRAARDRRDQRSARDDRASRRRASRFWLVNSVRGWCRGDLESVARVRVVNVCGRRAP